MRWNTKDLMGPPRQAHHNQSFEITSFQRILHATKIFLYDFMRLFCLFVSDMRWYLRIEQRSFWTCSFQCFSLLSEVDRQGHISCTFVALLLDCLRQIGILRYFQKHQIQVFTGHTSILKVSSQTVAGLEQHNLSRPSSRIARRRRSPPATVLSLREAAEINLFHLRR